MNQLLGNSAIEEIRGSMRGLTGKPAKTMAARLAADHKITLAHIYRLTKDLRPNVRKQRRQGQTNITGSSLEQTFGKQPNWS
jgi:hypothetical protein